MTQRKIVKYGDPILQRKTKPVQKIDREIITLIKDMLETMYLAPVMGLAANQVGVSLNLCVIDLRPEGECQPIILINPYITEKKGRTYEDEGCLSLPGIFVKLPRWRAVKVAAINEKGIPVEVYGEGLLARALQHELDHLSGRLLLDRIGFLKRLKVKKKIKQLKKEGKWK